MVLDPPDADYREVMPVKKKRMYFGHPLNTYDTPLEAELMAVIAKAFPDHEIINPNRPEHQRGYAEYEKTHKDAQGVPTGMGYFFEVLVPTCDAGVYLAFRDGMISAGCVGEAELQQQRGLPTWEITPDGVITTLYAPLDPARCLKRADTWARLTDQKKEVLSTEKIIFKPY